MQQLSLVDVSIGRVRILALSTDNLTLAASVSGDIRFYSVRDFVNKVWCDMLWLLFDFVL